MRLKRIIGFPRELQRGIWTGDAGRNKGVAPPQK